MNQIVLNIVLSYYEHSSQRNQSVFVARQHIQQPIPQVPMETLLVDHLDGVALEHTAYQIQIVFFVSQST